MSEGAPRRKDPPPPPPIGGSRAEGECSSSNNNALGEAAAAAAAVTAALPPLSMSARIAAKRKSNSLVQRDDDDDRAAVPESSNCANGTNNNNNSTVAAERVCKRKKSGSGARHGSESTNAPPRRLQQEQPHHQHSQGNDGGTSQNNTNYNNPNRRRSHQRDEPEEKKRGSSRHHPRQSEPQQLPVVRGSSIRRSSSTSNSQSRNGERANTTNNNNNRNSRASSSCSRRNKNATAKSKDDDDDNTTAPAAAHAVVVGVEDAAATAAAAAAVECYYDPNHRVHPLVADHDCTSLHALLHTTHCLSFARPNAQSIHSAATLLGLNHVLCDEPAVQQPQQEPPQQPEHSSSSNTIHNGNHPESTVSKLSASTTGLVSVAQLLSRLRPDRTNLTNNFTNDINNTKRNRNRDSAFAVPKLGTAPDRIKFWGGSSTSNNDIVWLKQQQQQQQQLPWRNSTAAAAASSRKNASSPPPSPLMMLDPRYVQLWRTPFIHTARVPVTSVQQAKLYQGVVASTTTTTKPWNFTVERGMSATVGVATPTITTGSDLFERGTASFVPNVLPNTCQATKPSTVQSQQQPWNNIALDAAWQAYTDASTSLSVSNQEIDLSAKTMQRRRDRISFIPLDQARALLHSIAVDSTTTTNGTKRPAPHGSTDAFNNSDLVGITAGFVAVINDNAMPCSSKPRSQSAEAMTTYGAPVASPQQRRAIGSIVFQFEWYRGVDQAVEESELILHIREINTRQPAVALESKEPVDIISDEPQRMDLMDEDDLFWVRLMLVAVVLEQARACRVWYAMVPRCTVFEQNILYVYFGMIPTEMDSTTMICDLNQTSSKLIFLRYQEECNKRSFSTTVDSTISNLGSVPSKHVSTKQRWLVHLPGVEEAKAAITPPVESDALETKDSTFSSLATKASSLHTADSWNHRVPLAVSFTGASKSKRDTKILFRAILDSKYPNAVELRQRNMDGTVGPELCLPTLHHKTPSLSILKSFDLPAETQSHVELDNVDDDELLQKLVFQQNALSDLEAKLEPVICSLLANVVLERVEYESEPSVSKRAAELRIMDGSRKLTEFRKERDVAWQQQLEKDMDAVCEICVDGEVTPDNQILFCETCNVAVHQMCYGIDQVPEGDYHCLACRRLGRDKLHADGVSSVRDPLPIFCELCPTRQGAFILTKTTDDAVDRFVHVVCAKWMGLDYVDERRSEQIEDVTSTKAEFRRHGIKCELCLGERGGMNQCSSNGCTKFYHVTCGRAVGNMTVIHGENCLGPVEDKPWKLFCPDHSDLKINRKPANVMTKESLIRAAQSFPPEPKPPPIPRPFYQLSCQDQKELLADPEYERTLINAILHKKNRGVRCDVCDVVDEDIKNLTRCLVCNVVFCSSCKTDVDDIKGSGNYKCQSCVFIESNQKAEQSFETPQCSCCGQQGGLLREAKATPINLAKWKKKPQQLKMSMFGKPIWVHSLCACWLPELELPKDTGIVDLSNVLLSNGRGGMIHGKSQCFLCGESGGLKMACDRKNCCWTTNRGEEKVVMHVTCARQAGFEVVVDQVRLNHSRGPLCYVRCYRHGGNDFNLRARLEDLLEIEKRRAGQDYSKADLTTNFADAARFLYSAISVLRTLGWAWRWAEFWVDYDSSWEPLIEIGQNEKKMSDVELKKVHSTRESRYQDARACRLAAFGAALRNRAYDIPEGFNNEALNRALTTIINTPSLVGPLSQYEKDFFVDWLGRAYRTKSRLLYFGENKNIVSSESEFCTYKNGSLKYELGERMLPGAEEIHIADVHKFETDDFLTNALLPNSTQKTPKSASFPSSKKSKLIPVLCPGEPKKIEKSSRRNRKNQLSETCATGDDTTDSGSQSRNRDRPIALRCSPKPTSKFREELNAKSPPVSVKKSPPASVEKSPPTSLERTPPASLEPTPPASLDPKPPASLEPTSPASVKPTAPYTGKRRGRPPRRRIMTEDLRQVKSVANAPPNAGGGVETIHEVPAGSKTKSEESGNTSNGDDGYVDANKIDHIRDVASALSATSDDFPSEGNDNDIPNNINDGVSDCPTRDIQVEDTTQFLSTDPTIKTMAQRHKSSEEIGGGNYRGLSSPFVENTINVKSENCGSALDVLPVDLNIEPLSQCPIGPPQLLPDSAGIDECSREETRPADVDDVIYSDKKSKRESRDRMVGNVETNQQTQAFDIDTAGKTSFKRKFKQIDETKDSTTQILTSDATSGVQAKNMSFTQEGTPAEEPDDDDIPIAVLVFEMKAKAEKGKKGDDNGGRNRSKREKIAGLDERPHTKDAPVIATRSKETPQQRGRRRGKRLAVVSGSSSIF